jgi:hypothetical protein
LLEDYAHYARGEAGTISPHVLDVTGVNCMASGHLLGTARAFVSE